MSTLADNLPHTVTVMAGDREGTNAEKYTSAGTMSVFIQPLRASADASIMGLWPDSTHKLYAEATDSALTGLGVRYVWGTRTFEQIAPTDSWDDGALADMEHLKIVLGEIFH